MKHRDCSLSGFNVQITYFIYTSHLSMPQVYFGSTPDVGHVAA